ncbi:23S rRNA (guanosine(2251)-2'-O)-methyltransferase RlmB [Fulvivirga sedimenti]|uniref:23S rRNA (Guanosine(2251)-2'-O)-methyltransferase RlmB n=1 Tax=Fulvivirga sedimenti TaxID=2879465 RepID=A0A9X1L2F3_9BACT|nr:23S rRNA (guanosine(2251)-2'-O)-methyltransferase RlmB [Fulvivirga sedimenti]MCA6078121.1 23S rRNA (guanosine(2251)-2'-O)-methyltransferase RlmB [Fulvivirga sedimenti]
MNASQSPKDYLFGIRAIMENIHAGKEIDKILLQKGTNNPLMKELIQEAKKHRVPISYVPGEKLNRITRKNHQGAIAFVSAVQYASLDHVIQECYNAGKEPFILILDRVTDVRNFGAIARTAEGAGMNAIVIPSRGSAAINADAMKTSAGALGYIPVCREENLKSTLNYLRESGIRILACTEKTEDLLFEVDMTGPLAILMGSEEDGISPEYLKLCDARGMIPMFGNIESLNVSVSAAIAIYEAVRQRSLTS